VKFPPYFHGKWFFFDYKKKFIKAMTLDSAGRPAETREYLYNLVGGASGFTRMTDLKFGPDGSMYVLEYGHITDYTASTSGALHKVNYVPPSPECLPGNPDAVGLSPRSKPGSGRVLHAGMARFELPPDAKGAVLYDAGGRRVWEFKVPAEGRPDPVTLPKSLPLGLYHWKAIR
jgi:hypothetical protein